MKTKFKIIRTSDLEHPFYDIDLRFLQQTLPASFAIEKNGDDIYITIQTLKNDDDSSKYLINRELDRIFFLTDRKLTAEMVKKYVTVALEQKYNIFSELPDNLKPQKWNYDLSLQLRLWSIAVETHDIQIKALFFFQIIELSYPSNNTNYPIYSDHQQPPHPRSECRFLRNLVAHSGDVGSSQLEKYCKYLDMPALMFDITDPHHQEILSQKIALFQDQAKITIDEELTKLS